MRNWKWKSGWALSLLLMAAPGCGDVGGPESDFEEPGPGPSAGDADDDLAPVSGRSRQSAQVDRSPATWSVTPIAQRSVTDVGESACGPTATAEVLVTLGFPGVNPKAIYMGGTQDYEYDGAADAYRNVSFQRPDRGTSDLPRAVRRDYSGDYSGARRDELRRALELYGVTSSIVSSEDATYQAVTQAPVLVRLNAFGDSGLRHYGVLSGYDPRGSRERALHAVRLVDSYDNWRASRERRPTVRTIGVREFFDGAGSSGGAAWFREGIRLQIPGTEEARQNTFVVDVGHNPVNGIVTEAGRITLDEVARWRFKYHGPYFYHSGTGSRAVRWSPGIRRAGRYEVTVFAPTGPAMGSTRYTLHDARGVELASRDVDQYSRRAGTSDVVLAADRELGPGAYVRVAALAAGTGVRAVRFRWIAAPAGRR